MTEPDHMERATTLAARITTRAANALSPLDREMSLMKWPPEFRAIMWEAVAALAASQAAECRLEDGQYGESKK